MVELIYRTLFEAKKIVSKPESVKLDWDEWGDYIQNEFGKVESPAQLYGIIATFKIFNIPLTLSFFCRHFDLPESKLKNRLKEKLMPYQIEPIIFHEHNNTIQPKHDVIAELFFLFHEKKFTINNFIIDLLEDMDKKDIELLLQKMEKPEFQKDNTHNSRKLDYWSIINVIYKRIQARTLYLSDAGSAMLCSAFLRLNKKEKGKYNAITKEVLTQIAPPVELHKTFLILYTEWGIWLHTIGNDSLAEEKFRAVVDIAPKDLPSRTELGRLLSNQPCKEQEAAALFRKVISIDPKNIQARTELGRLLAKQGEEAEAEKLFREALKIDPKNLHPHTELGRLLAKQGKYTEAEKLFREAMRIEPTHIQSRTELGRMYVNQGKEAEAEKLFREALKIDPKNLHPRTELGRLLFKQGKYAEAEKLFRETIRIEPNALHSRTELGRLLARQGKEAEAEKLFREVIRIEPNALHPRVELGMLLAKQGKEAEAEAAFREVLNIDPQNVLAQKELARLPHKPKK